MRLIADHSSPVIGAGALEIDMPHHSRAVRPATGAVRAHPYRDVAYAKSDNSRFSTGVGVCRVLVLAHCNSPGACLVPACGSPPGG